MQPKNQLKSTQGLSTASNPNALGTTGNTNSIATAPKLNGLTADLDTNGLATAPKSKALGTAGKSNALGTAGKSNALATATKPNALATGSKSNGMPTAQNSNGMPTAQNPNGMGMNPGSTSGMGDVYGDDGYDYDDLDAGYDDPAMSNPSKVLPAGGNPGTKNSEYGNLQLNGQTGTKSSVGLADPSKSSKLAQGQGTGSSGTLM
ncbi:hypothetical protein MCOR25_007497 [Pyricularia grisea]|nr:hypothetical protein MCOR25_007497 [Pyricularia grisea]